MRPGQALRLWHDVSLALVRDAEPDLSARQVSVLITIYLEPQPHTVRALAAKLGVTKPVITRALDTMGRQGLVSRKRDPGRPPQRAGAAHGERRAVPGAARRSGRGEGGGAAGMSGRPPE